MDVIDMGKITLVGVGLELGQMTFAAAQALKSGAQVILHTERIGCTQWLREERIPYTTLDYLYEECEDFDAHASLAADAVQTAAQAGDVAYVVYDVRDRSALRLLERFPNAAVIAGPPVEGALLAHLDGATRMLEASDWESFRLNAQENTLVRELNSRELTSEVKLKLMECYPDETRCFLLNGDGSIARVPLYDLDRMKAYDHRSCALIPAQRDLMHLERYSFDELVQIMHMLQAPDGCPWDRAQTHESLRPYMLEEVYECIDAINEGDPVHLYDELGDLLMQVVMHAEIGKKHGEFDVIDSITAICQKMIARHSHIFGSDCAATPDSVLDLWARNKMKERGQQSYTEVLREVSHGMPGLMRARKIIGKAAGAGVFRDDAAYLAQDAAQIVAQIPSAQDREAAVGEALLRICALCKAADVDPELAINEAADRFVDRFEQLEAKLQAEGQKFPQPMQDKYWDFVKSCEKADVWKDL